MQADSNIQAAEKRCGRCKQAKPLDAFHGCASQRDGKNGTCKICTALAQKQRYGRDKHIFADRAKARAVSRAHLVPVFETPTKRCSVCEEAKPLDQFNRSPRYHLGVTAQCKVCRYAVIRKWKADATAKQKPQVTSKTCSRCGFEKPGSAFRKLSTAADGLCASCRECCRRKWAEMPAEERATRMMENHLSVRYGLSIEDYQAMLLLQEYKCALCRSFMKKIYVDHCHATNMVRGLLCNSCNTRLYALENAAFNKLAVAYLAAPGRPMPS